jgi:hypothetical protein
MIFPSISRNHRNMIWCVWIAFFVWPNVQSAHVQAEEPLVTKTYHIGDLIIFPRGFGELVVNTTCLADPFEWGFNPNLKRCFGMQSRFASVFSGVSVG